MRGKSIVAGLLLVASAFLAVLTGRSVYSRVAFGTWDPTAQPNRIEYCDRRYYPRSHVNRAQIDGEGNGFGVFPFRQVGTTAGGTPIFAKPLPDSVRHKSSLPCSMVVYLKAGAGDYVAYVISGGP